MIHDDSHPPAEWPRLRQEIRKPWNPETRTGRNSRQIHVPQLAGIAGLNATRFDVDRTSHLLRDRLCLLQDSAHGRSTQVQPGTGENLSDSDLSHRRAESFQLPDQVAHEVWKPIHRL